MVLVVVEGLTGGHDDRVASVCTKGVKVLHVAANDSVLSRRQRRPG